jgi:hypothetical protein
MIVSDEAISNFVYEIASGERPRNTCTGTQVQV